MMLFTLALTLSFASSDRLAGAYGTAVSATGFDDDRIALPRHARDMALAFCCLSWCIRPFPRRGCRFLRRQSTQDRRGWLGAIAGRRRDLRRDDDMARRHGCARPEQDRDRVTLAHFVHRLRDKKIRRQEGTALFFTRLQGVVPPVIADHVRQLGGLYRQVVALTVRFSPTGLASIRNSASRSTVLAPVFGT